MYAMLPPDEGFTTIPSQSVGFRSPGSFNYHCQNPTVYIPAVRSTLAEQSTPLAAADVAARFSRANMGTVEELLETLVTVGRARQTDDGKYVI